MMYYYIFLVVIIFAFYIFCKLFKFDSLIFLKFSFFLMFLLLALRSENVGTDLANYKAFFEMCSYFPLFKIINLLEPCYSLYTYFLYYILHGNFHLFLVITSFVSLYGIYVFIKENSNNYLLSVILYICFNFYLFSFSGLRQSIALSITFFAFKYVKEKKFLKFLLFCFIAILFHKSALFFIPVYFINRINITKKQFPLFLVFLIFIYFFRYQIIGLFFRFLYNDYSLLENSDSGIKLLIIYIFVLILITLFKNSYIKRNINNNMWYNMLCIGIIIQIFSTVEGNAFRAAYYYTYSLIILLPSFVECFKKKEQLIINYFIIMLFFLYYYFSLNNSSLVDIYEFYWIK